MKNRRKRKTKSKVLNIPAKDFLDGQIERVVAAIKKMPGPKVVKILVFSRRCEYTFLLVKGDRMFVLDDGYSYVVATMEAFTSKLSTALLNGGLLVNQIADGDDGKVYVAAFSEGVIRPFSPEDVKELAEQCAKAGEPVELFDGASYGSFADFLE